MTLTGACLCGRVRFAVEEPLGPAGYCHCTRCQRRTGGGSSAQVRIDAATLRVTEGEEHVRAYHPATGFDKLFCAQCGSALFARNPLNPAQMSVRLGAFDGDPGVRPQFRQFVADAAPWEPIPEDGLLRFPEGRPGGFTAPG
jgi:hypothetical protein